MAGIPTRFAYAREIMDWLTVSVLNVELMVTWLILWPALHVGLLLIAHFLLHLNSLSPRILILVEVFPAFMLALAVLRMTTSTSMLVRVARAVGAAQKAGVAPPRWTQEPGVLFRLAKPSDWDIAIGVVLVAALEILAR